MEATSDPTDANKETEKTKEAALVMDTANKTLTEKLNESGKRGSSWLAATQSLTAIVRIANDISNESGSLTMVPLVPASPISPGDQDGGKREPQLESSEGIADSLKTHLQDTSITFMDYTSDMVHQFLKLQQIRIKITDKEDDLLEKKLDDISKKLTEVETLMEEAKSSAKAKKPNEVLFKLREAMMKARLMNRLMLKDGEDEINRLVRTKQNGAVMDTARSFTVGAVSAAVLGFAAHHAPQRYIPRVKTKHFGILVGGCFGVISAVVTFGNLGNQLRKLWSWKEEWVGEFRSVSFDIKSEMNDIRNLRDAYKCAVSGEDAETHKKHMLETLQKIRAI